MLHAQTCGVITITHTQKKSYQSSELHSESDQEYPDLVAKFFHDSSLFHRGLSFFKVSALILSLICIRTVARWGCLSISWSDQMKDRGDLEPLLWTRRATILSPERGILSSLPQMFATQEDFRAYLATPAHQLQRTRLNRAPSTTSSHSVRIIHHVAKLDADLTPLKLTIGRVYKCARL